MTESQWISVSYGVPRWKPTWAVPEVPVPESDTHDFAITYLKALLEAWAQRVSGNHRVFRNMGLRWVPEEPRSGFDPDLCVVQNAPPATGTITSLQLWLPEHPTPRLAIEVVSPNHPYKDYVDTPERAAACGIPELWIYDPLLAGPKLRGGPFVLQIWRATDSGYVREHAGPGPAYSAELQAFLHPTETRAAALAKLRISDDPEARSPWLTEAEQERQSRLDEHQRRLDEQRRRLDAERRIVELEAKLKQAGEGGG